MVSFFTLRWYLFIPPTGSICHVDFGFFLTNSPGNVAFEPSLKLTEELVETLGGEDSRRFGVFRRMVVRGCMVLRRDIDTLKSMIEVRLRGYFL